jgi:actin-like ATPase involved in cell morphogenesis
MSDFLKKNDEVDVKKKALTDTLGIDLGTLNTVVAIPESEIYSFPIRTSTSSFAVMMVIGLKYRLHIKGKTYRLLNHYLHLHL